MFPNFIPNSLVIFWIFFGFLSILPMIFAVTTQNKADKRIPENKNTMKEGK